MGLPVDSLGRFNPRTIDKRTSPFLPPTTRSAPVTVPGIVGQVERRSVKDAIADFLVPSAYWDSEDPRVFIASQFYRQGDILKVAIQQNPEMYVKAEIEVMLMSLAEDQIEFRETAGSGELLPVSFSLDPDLDSRSVSKGPAIVSYIGREDALLEDMLEEEKGKAASKTTDDESATPPPPDLQSLLDAL
jgi:hypothetical protein